MCNFTLFSEAQTILKINYESFFFLSDFETDGTKLFGIPKGSKIGTTMIHYPTPLEGGALLSGEIFLGVACD